MNKKLIKKIVFPGLVLPLVFFGLNLGSVVYGQATQGISAEKTSADPFLLKLEDSAWKKVPIQTVLLMAQPMALPRPKLTLTEKLSVQALHNSKSIVFRLKWKDPELSEAGKLGLFSDAVALEFPVALKDGNPPSPFMGEQGKPVHIFHWRAQYQKDKKLGHAPTMKELYPNMSVDGYPMDYKVSEAPHASSSQKRQFIPGQAAGNPQSYVKNGVDEIFAEGFGSSSLVEKRESESLAVWNKGEWTVQIARPLKTLNGSLLSVGGKNYVCFAVWQGGQREVGSRKSVTLMWVELKLKA
ncbi:hypothetical protein COW36_19090 [bacterium (Candidatus Blackallbacteria) CG17_big_fil_post_rev_8_21_14_2_50_48_46]|uniref:Cytochrome c-552/DMSO reductase-like haem-binding domain-containing protein n=1 Tax=bacterium (Candidatus Blackallbacteria) CG17_big_fil_post_rev_8_21_14_2_50_48_46 TaxID=2014261 RepID=A0A2M7G014_9BACT|nr:MAG: hypothetical protein COW64_25380 [bacterium (Candidatus Blackallbacteria) CG18_big_fil_WC_8_21_14_2_50_49_26]PIW15030.1 MAG: hypothetical protein COW36_19090 [bacterium (Candidatus Blackallbacteria) CG17_big_fil_post_rev_8_21_14_2_50_48_46]PIW47647.1 MAG: hypothetical protein COW20_12230 [bacterium (Candidatus Blackallbacteria) CG13_big_fil_rev_8_21_14_2_50_49_14]